MGTKIDFRKVKVQMTIEGEAIVFDLSKRVGNTIYAGTADIGLSDFAKEIYYKGEVAIANDQIDSIRSIITNSAFVVPVKRSIIDLLTIKEEKDGNN